MENVNLSVIIVNNGTHALDFVLAVTQDGVLQSTVSVMVLKYALHQHQNQHQNQQLKKQTNIVWNINGLVLTKEFILLGFKDAKRFVSVVVQVIILIVITFVHNFQRIV